MTKDEALKLALEAEGVQPSKKSMAITELYALFGAPHNADINLARLNKLLDELMAQPEQEPVAWRTFDGEGNPVSTTIKKLNSNQPLPAYSKAKNGNS